MSHHDLPDAISDFLDGLGSGDADLATRGAALSVVGAVADARYRGVAGLRELLSDSGALSETGDWQIDYAMDSEFVLSNTAGTRLQLLLDCGRIAYLRVSASRVSASRVSDPEAVAA
jgi:hypothetical protein